MAMVDVDDSSPHADSQPKLDDVDCGSAAVPRSSDEPGELSQ